MVVIVAAFNPEGIAPQSPGLAPAFLRQPRDQVKDDSSTLLGLRRCPGRSFASR
jgi:hypothetical protein